MHESSETPLPEAFCWTRFGPEAGEPLETILARKEEERVAGGGTFYWGIGSSVGPAIRTLVSSTMSPEVLFSPIASRPRKVDISPEHVVRWAAGRDLSGESVTLPDSARVTSRWDPERPSTPRYALVCESEQPLREGDHGELGFAALRNLCSGAPLGPSQVTAVVRRAAGRAGEGRSYRIAMRVRLRAPYLVRLTTPVPISVTSVRADGVMALSL